MTAFIIAACAIALIATNLHTTVVYCALFACGVVALPCCTALVLTCTVVGAWMTIEGIIHVRSQIAGTRFYWQFGNFQLAMAM